MMAWHDDPQRRRDAAEARALKEAETAKRQRTAKKLYEDGITQEEISRRVRCGGDTLTKWIREGGWKRSEG
jgi:uncharacterized protein YjcR